VIETCALSNQSKRPMDGAARLRQTFATKIKI
jgi:hypothetical protein